MTLAVPLYSSDLKQVCQHDSRQCEDQPSKRTLCAVLALLSELAGSSLWLGGKTEADESVLGLELESILAVVDQGEAGRAATTKVGAEAEDDDLVLGGLVHRAELVSQLVLGDAGNINKSALLPCTLEREPMGQRFAMLAKCLLTGKNSLRTGRVEDIHNHLLALEQTVGLELAGTQRDRALGVHLASL